MKWISIKTRLPDHNDEGVVLLEGKIRKIARYIPHQLGSLPHLYSTAEWEKVTHWLELPAAPTVT